MDVTVEQLGDLRDTVANNAQDKYKQDGGILTKEESEANFPIASLPSSATVGFDREELQEIARNDQKEGISSVDVQVAINVARQTNLVIPSDLSAEQLQAAQEAMDIYVDVIETITQLDPHSPEFLTHIDNASARLDEASKDLDLKLDGKTLAIPYGGEYGPTIYLDRATLIGVTVPPFGQSGLKFSMQDPYGDVVDIDPNELKRSARGVLTR